MSCIQSCKSGCKYASAFWTLMETLFIPVVASHPVSLASHPVSLVSHLCLWLPILIALESFQKQLLDICFLYVWLKCRIETLVIGLMNAEGLSLTCLYLCNLINYEKLIFRDFY